MTNARCFPSLRYQNGERLTMPRGRPTKSGGIGSTAQPQASKANGNGAYLGFEAQLFLAANKLRQKP
jgi:hypothetical protein